VRTKGRTNYIKPTQRYIVIIGVIPMQEKEIKELIGLERIKAIEFLQELTLRTQLNGKSIKECLFYLIDNEIRCVLESTPTDEDMQGYMEGKYPKMYKKYFKQLKQ
jgi:hypothetical protein